MRWSKQIGALVALLLVSGLILLLIAVGANLVQSFSMNVLKEASWTNQHTVQAASTARTIMNIYFLVSGIVFLGFFFLMENRLVTSGIPHKSVLRRTFFTLGVELLILGIMQLIMMTYTPVLLLPVGLTVMEIMLGVGLIYLGRHNVAKNLM